MKKSNKNKIINTVIALLGLFSLYKKNGYLKNGTNKF